MKNQYYRRIGISRELATASSAQRDGLWQASEVTDCRPRGQVKQTQRWPWVAMSGSAFCLTWNNSSKRGSLSWKYHCLALPTHGKSGDLHDANPIVWSTEAGACYPETCAVKKKGCAKRLSLEKIVGAHSACGFHGSQGRMARDVSLLWDPSGSQR